ncbi:BamA/TamA family outer membrane protein [Algoriphagus sp. H41]|uniref:BamA/TamA family outer membrane protein n=1 Tax=Algoriphagus oliviformis TaxID=2811231 RepID=A0ABS3C6H7_9BACT|nr:BamA/TamA family outer membrane protein [Algoriphagus oliviformis]MBN7812582.1 BamA/TamA family outer membrane protein [Algoriphagus oliviformis]
MKILTNSLATAVLLMLILVGCSVKKYIPEDEFLYTGAELEVAYSGKVDGKKKLNAELEGLLRPEPNGKFLGMYVGLWAHYKTRGDSAGFIPRFINKKWGEEPVYFKQVNTSRTEELILNRLENRGFFYGTATSEVFRKNKFAGVTYTAKVGEPYRMDTLIIERDSSQISREIVFSQEKPKLKKGDRFDLDRLKQERSRIDSLVKLKGYYNFNADYLIFEADTNDTDSLRNFRLYLRMKNAVPQSGKVPYVVDSIKVFPNYSIEEDETEADTVVYNEKFYIQEGTTFKEDLLDQYILIGTEERYDPQKSRLSSNRLSNIGNYKFVNLRYEDLKIFDSTGHLSAEFHLSPMTKRSLRAELLGVSKSNSFAGPTLGLAYRNRNLFQGGEMINITARAGYEFQVASGNQDKLHSLELGLQGDLIFPRIIFFVPVRERFSYSVPKTKISLGTEYLARGGLYRLNSFFTSFGYLWNANRYAFHEFTPININLVNLTYTTPEFEEILDSNPFLRKSFEQNFILGINYVFSYNKLNDRYRTHGYFLGLGLDFAGNLANGLENLFGESDGKILGLEYAQYGKLDLDLRYHLNLSREQTIATRLYAGWGLPFNRSLSLPYSKQFFSGGPHSVRAFRIRSIGPGSYRPPVSDNNSYFDQTGDIRMEGNIEYRFPIVSFLKGALFMDAGNIWLQNENEALPGGKFSSSWWKELAVGTGLGLRIDIQYFVIRFDLATPVRVPYLPEGDRWGNSFDIGSKTWRRENLIFNFAIGYPF